MNAPLAIISGISGGIGSTVARYLWLQGWSIVGIGRTLSKVEAMADWFRDHEGLATPVGQKQIVELRCFDVADQEEHWRVRTALDLYPTDLRLLVVCHGAAPAPEQGHRRIAVAVARRLFSTDVLGAFLLCQTVYDYMRPNGGGTIALVSSIHAHATYPERVPYSIAKSAMGGLARGLAVEWGKDNIQVNALLPWQTFGERTSVVAAEEAARTGVDTMELYRQRSPMRGLVDPQDIARTVLWLSECPSVSGIEIPIDCAVGASIWHRGFVEGE